MIGLLSFWPCSFDSLRGSSCRTLQCDQFGPFEGEICIRQSMQSRRGALPFTPEQTESPVKHMLDEFQLSVIFKRPSAPLSRWCGRAQYTGRFSLKRKCVHTPLFVSMLYCFCRFSLTCPKHQNNFVGV